MCRNRRVTSMLQKIPLFFKPNHIIGKNCYLEIATKRLLFHDDIAFLLSLHLIMIDHLSIIMTAHICRKS